MPVYLLDTNHASPLVTLHHPLRQRVLAALTAGDKFAICVPALSEVLYGISVLPRAVANRAEWANLRASFDYYGLDEMDATMAAEMQVELRRHGWQLETVDSLIAAVAIRYYLTLLTTDKDFQPIIQLKQENWI